MAGSDQSKVPLEPEIVVHGRRTIDRYRIHPDLRATQSAGPDWRATATDPRLVCQAVGPMGCGIKPLPILTIGSDGGVRIGTPEAH